MCRPPGSTFSSLWGITLLRKAAVEAPKSNSTWGTSTTSEIISTFSQWAAASSGAPKRHTQQQQRQIQNTQKYARKKARQRERSDTGATKRKNLQTDRGLRPRVCSVSLCVLSSFLCLLSSLHTHTQAHTIVEQTR